MAGLTRILIGAALLLAAALAPMLAPVAGAQPAPKRVLLLHSYGPHFAPWNTLAKDFREDLNQRVPQALDVYEGSLQSERFGPSRDQSAFLAYLRALFDGVDPGANLNPGKITGVAEAGAERNHDGVHLEKPSRRVVAEAVARPQEPEPRSKKPISAESASITSARSACASSADATSPRPIARRPPASSSSTRSWPTLASHSRRTSGT